MAFREQPELRVVDMASSVEGKPSPKSYNELFDNLVRTLLAAADAPKQAAEN
jgi:hypothetical protein